MPALAGHRLLDDAHLIDAGVARAGKASLHGTFGDSKCAVLDRSRVIIMAELLYVVSMEQIRMYTLGAGFSLHGQTRNQDSNWQARPFGCRPVSVTICNFACQVI